MSNTLIVRSILPIVAFSLLDCDGRHHKQETDTIEVTTPASPQRPAVIYNSTDGGKSWAAFDNGIPYEATVSSFFVTNDKILASTDVHGIYSIAIGQNLWKRLDENLPEKADVNALTASGGAWIIGTFAHGILVSKDGGKNWINSLTSFNVPVRCLYAKDNVLLAGADDGIYTSRDHGNTWDHIWKGVQVNGFAYGNNTLYAALMNGAIKSTDDGVHWAYIYKPHTLHDIAADDEKVYAMTLGSGLQKSSNAGLIWETINDGMGTFNLYTFEVKKFGNTLFAAQWYGIYTSDNWGGRWTLIKNGLPDSTAFTTLEATELGLVAGIGLREGDR